MKDQEPINRKPRTQSVCALAGTRPSTVGRRFFGLMTVAIALAGWSGCHTQSKPRTEDPQQNPLRFATVSLQFVQNEVAIPAKVQADPQRLVHVFPPVSGRLLSLNVRPGDVVRQGQAIAIIESSDAASARSDYEKSRIEAARSHQAEQRAALLLQHEAMSEKDYEDIRAQAESAKADLARTEQRLRMLGLNTGSISDQVTVRSPRSGVVLEIGAANGELSKSLDNAASIATIADLRSVWIVGDVYEKDVALASRGMPAEVTFAALPGAKYSGTISNVSDVIDPTTRSLKIRVALPNAAHKLKPEMFATIHLVGRKQSLMTVPTTAVLHEGNASFVLVKKAEGNYEKRTVTVVNSDSDKTEIASGLQPGEIVVTVGAELLRESGAGS